jgi:hypothetical protein
MAPREVPLLDHPDDVWPHDREYPELQGGNFTRGFFSTYGALRERDEDSGSDFEEECRQAELRAAREKKTQKHALATKFPTITAKRAASALSSNSSAFSRPTSTAVTPSFAAPTAAVRARQPAVAVVKKPSPLDRNPRFTAAKTASNSTIGYSRGRVVSASADRQPLARMHTRPGNAAEHDPQSSMNERRSKMTSYELASPPRKHIMQLSELHLGLNNDDDHDDSDITSPEHNMADHDDDELEDFQLAMPAEQ